MLSSLGKVEALKGANDIFDLSQVKLPFPANPYGQKGIKCLNCGGFGYTIHLVNKRAEPCPRCEYTGVEPIPK